MALRPLALLLVFLLPLTGCFDESSPPEQAPPPTSEPPQPVRLPGKFPNGVEVRYSLAPTFNAAHRVDVLHGVRLSADGSATLTYIHPNHPTFDSTLNGTIAPDGSWERLDFACEPGFPDSRNTLGCNEDLGGYGQGLGLAGPFFGYLMLAGLELGDNGTVARTFRIGTQTTTLWFSVERNVGEWTVRPANLASRALGSGFGHSNRFDPIGCSIFNAEITVEPDGGVPLRCVQIEPEETFPVWQLESKGLLYDAEFHAAPPAVRPAGSARWPNAGEGVLPFALSEALDVARERDGRIAGALDDSDTWLGSSGMAPKGETLVGTCPACFRRQVWSWDVRLENPRERLSFTVDKTVDELLGTSYEYSSESPKPQTAFPSRFPVRIDSLEARWTHAADLLGFEPLGIGYEMPHGGGFVEATGAVEPTFLVFFASEQGGGYAPVLYYRADGSLELFMADGAAPNQDLEGRFPRPPLS